MYIAPWVVVGNKFISKNKSLIINDLFFLFRCHVELIYFCVSLHFSLEKIDMEKAEKFYQFRSEKVMVAFNVKEIKDCEHLDLLLSDLEGTLASHEATTLDLALHRYQNMGRGWNEEELKMHFISTILNICDVNIPEVCKTFYERPLTGILNGYELHVVTDCMVASYNVAGQPVRPYFFLQEFKQAQRFGKTDPEGQMLVAMLLAQQINQNDDILYGCYVVENNWRFTTLNGSNYCVSRQFDATKKSDLLEIVFVLRKLKSLILNK